MSIAIIVVHPRKLPVLKLSGSGFAFPGVSLNMFSLKERLMRKSEPIHPLTARIAGILLFAACLFSTQVEAGPAEGQKLFESKNCGACHLMSGPVTAVPIAERGNIKGPPLWFAGSKFKAEWLSAWLADPQPVRRVVYNTLTIGNNPHPVLSAAEAAEVSEFLMTQVDKEMKSGQVVGEPLSRRDQFNAEKLFSKKQVCFGCHEYPAKSGPLGGYTGPTMVGAGQRLNPDWVYSLLQDNTRYYPNGRMPVYGDQAFNAFTEDELKLLAQYIGNL